MCAGFRFFNADTTPGLTSEIFGILSGVSTAPSSLDRDSDNTSLIFYYSGGDVRADDCLTPDTWHYIEVEWKLTTSGNGGYAKVYVDGNEVIDTGAVNIANFSFISSYGFRIGVQASTNQTAGNNFAFDDVYCMEIDGVEHTAPLGACRVYAMRPTADATPNDWTPSTGSDNFALVDDTDVDQTDYVDATTTGDDDHYTLGSLQNTDTVHAMRIDVACEAVDGTPTLHIGFDDGTADEEDLGTVATGSVQNFHQTFEEDPSNAAWTKSSAEAIEATQRMTE
jgi:hypothetical protein